MAYPFRYTTNARQSIEACIEYLLHSVGGDGNAQAAKNFLKDYSKTLDKLLMSAESFALCENGKLRAQGVRKIHFSRLKYKIFYTIEDGTVIIQLICHDLRNFPDLL